MSNVQIHVLNRIERYETLFLPTPVRLAALHGGTGRFQVQYDRFGGQAIVRRCTRDETDHARRIVRADYLSRYAAPTTRAVAGLSGDVDGIVHGES